MNKTWLLLLALLCGCGGNIDHVDPAAETEADDLDSIGQAAIPTPSIQLFYVCGNTFKIWSYEPAAVTVTFAVERTGETGTLSLPAPAGGVARSETFLSTRTVGTVFLFRNGVRINAYANQKKPCQAPDSNSARLGSWSNVFPWPAVAIHATLLPDGRVATWSANDMPYVWSPSTNSFQMIESPSHVFCSGHALLEDGRLLVSGGHISNDHGLPDTNFFDWRTSRWTKGPKMRAGRWYPTVTTLANGDVLSIAGRDESSTNNPYPEVWSAATNSWRVLTGAFLQQPYYPRMFLLPNGRVLYTGAPTLSRYLDTNGAGRWITGPTSRFGDRNYGTAVMYEPGKVALIGGNVSAPTKTVELLDTNVSGSQFRYTASMAYARRQLNATLLPDGKILVTGGTGAPGPNNPAGAVLAAEVFDPTTERWTTLASMKIHRLYHSTALLLTDGRVLSAGGGEGGGGVTQKNAELYSPPYLFNTSGGAAARPSISSAPAAVGWNQTFTVTSPQASAIRQVTLLRLGSVTHALNMNQRFNRLSFTTAGDGLRVVSPLKREEAPPGHYMLFIIDGNGVPSVAKVIQLR